MAKPKAGISFPLSRVVLGFIWLLTVSFSVIFLFHLIRINKDQILRTQAGRTVYDFVEDIKPGKPTVNLEQKANSNLLPASGPLQIDSVNSRYFKDGNGKAILLVGDHTWYTFQDSGASNPPEAFDYNAYLDFLEANHINFFRMFVFEQAKGSVLVGDDYYFRPLPYLRTGPGNALDGEPKFDLTRFNEPYFDRLRERVKQAGDRGIYVSIQLFEGFSPQSKPYMAAANPWPGHPFNQDNNVNGINGDPNGNGEGEETETMQNPEVLALQEVYVRKVVDTVNDLDNVLFEICNEGNENSQDWQYHLINYIKSYERTKPKQHPVGMTVEWPNGDNAELFASPADWISPNSYFDDPPVADSSKIIVADTDHLCYPCGNRIWMWKAFTRGENVSFMDPYDCKGDPSPPACDPNDPIWVNLRANLGYALGFANRMNLRTMTPLPALCSTGYCLANPVLDGAEYLVYLPDGGSVDVDLSSSPLDLSVEWFDPLDGSTHAGEAIQGGDSSESFSAPFSGDAVLYIFDTALSQSTTSGKQTLQHLTPVTRRTDSSKPATPDTSGKSSHCFFGFLPIATMIIFSMYMKSLVTHA